MLTEAEQQVAEELVHSALTEDLQGLPDITTQLLIPAHARGRIDIVSRQPGVLCGGVLVPLILEQLKQYEVEDAVAYDHSIPDGSPLAVGTVIAELQGSMRVLLTAERTILNFLTLLSGVASLTRQYVDAVTGTKARILETRKTLPGLRALQKYAVRCGGGTNHRVGLYDAVLVKDNHLAWYREQHAGSLADAVRHVRAGTSQGMIVEFEVDSLQQLQELLPGRPDIVLLDNMTPEQLHNAVELRDASAPEVLLEASGGVNLQSVSGIAHTGVDRISIGALTHSAPALDIGFDWQAGNGE